MTGELFNDLYKLICKHTNEIGEEAFYDSLIKSTTSKKTGKRQEINLESLFSENIPNAARREKILQSILNDRSNIVKLYEGHIHSISDGQKMDELFTSLLYLCLAENTSKFARTFSRQHLKPPTFKATEGRDKQATHFKSLLDQYHKIIVSGEPGIGKSHFIRYFLTRCNINDYCYISYDSNTDIQTNLHQIQYTDLYGSTYFGGNYELMDKRFSSSLLIIDNMYPYSSSDNTLQPDLEWLSKLSINIIVITLNPIKQGSFFTYELPPLSNENLLQLFTTDAGFAIPEESLQKKLFMKAGQNALMASLIARLCKKKLEHTPAESPSSILENTLCQLEYPDNHIDNKETSALRYKHGYTDYEKSLDIIGHIKSVCRKSFEYIDTTSRNYMKWLCCFGCSQLPLNFISGIILNYQHKYLVELHDIGLITLTDDAVQLSSLISHAVFASEKPHPDEKEFKVICQNLMLFLQKYDETLSVPYLSNALLVFEKTLYKKVPIRHNPKQTTAAKHFENWQELLYLIYNYYNQNGDFEIAEQIASDIHYPNMANSHSPLDARFFHLGNNMQSESGFRKVPEMIDKLCSIIEGAPDLQGQTDITYFVINTLDNIIGIYCQSFFDNHIFKTENRDYQQSLINALCQLLNYIISGKYDTKLCIPYEKIEYYLTCYRLLVNQPNISSFSGALADIKKFKNINYRIRGIAFVLFLQSHYIYSLNSVPLYPGCAGPTELFNTLHAQGINYLHGQIPSCKLIPFHTFRMCLLSYISTAMIQYCLLSTSHASDIPVIVTADTVRELINRSLLSKDEFDSALKNIEEYL